MLEREGVVPERERESEDLMVLAWIDYKNINQHMNHPFFWQASKGEYIKLKQTFYNLNRKETTQGHTYKTSKFQHESKRTRRLQS